MNPWQDVAPCRVAVAGGRLGDEGETGLGARVAGRAVWHVRWAKVTRARAAVQPLCGVWAAVCDLASPTRRAQSARTLTGIRNGPTRPLLPNVNGASIHVPPTAVECGVPMAINGWLRIPARQPQEGLHGRFHPSGQRRLDVVPRVDESGHRPADVERHRIESRSPRSSETGQRPIRLFTACPREKLSCAKRPAKCPPGML